VLFVFILYALLELHNRRLAARERGWSPGTDDEEAGKGPSGLSKVGTGTITRG
jgi:hypothetical protein